MNIETHFGIEFLIDENEIYLDSATSGKMPHSTIAAMNEFYLEHGGGINRGTHKHAFNAGKSLEKSLINSFLALELINQAQISGISFTSP